MIKVHTLALLYQYIPVHMIKEPLILMNGDILKGEQVVKKSTYLRDLKNIFQNEQARSEMPADTLVYNVESYFPVPEGTLGGLFVGFTFIHPGLVGTEYFMTRGHFHAVGNRSEFYWGVKGEGILLLMDRDRKCRAEKVQEGSLHYIPADTAHRVINTGSTILSFGACWPSDAGHNYEEIALHGFAARFICEDGKPLMIKQK